MPAQTRPEHLLRHVQLFPQQAVDQHHAPVARLVEPAPLAERLIERTDVPLEALERAFRDGARRRRRETSFRPEQLAIGVITSWYKLDVSMPWRRLSSSDNGRVARTSCTNDAIISVSAISRSPQCSTGSLWNGPCERDRRESRATARSPRQRHAIVGEGDLARAEVVAQELRAARASK